MANLCRVSEQEAALQQYLDPDGHGIGAGRSTLGCEGTDVDEVSRVYTEAPRIETHLVDDDRNAPNQAVPVYGEGIIEYAATLPHKLPQPSPPSALYRWMNPRQEVEGLEEEEFAERLICRERGLTFSKTSTMRTKHGSSIMTSSAVLL